MTYTNLPDSSSYNLPQARSEQPGGSLGRKYKATVKSERRGHSSSFPIEQLSVDLLIRCLHWYIVGVCEAAARHSHSSKLFHLEDGHILEDTRGPAPYSWLAIRHVCRAWRKIALTYPQLSAHIFLTRPECVQDLLGRVGPVEITVYDASIEYNTKHRARVADSCSLILAHFAQVAHGRLCVMDDTLAKELSEALGDRSCNARSLALVFTQLGIRQSPFPAGAHFPELRELSCHNMALPNLALNAPRLRALRLTSDIGMNMLSADVLALLGSTSGLEELVLDGILAESETWPHVHEVDPETARWHTVTLPTLRLLRVSTQYATTAMFFLHQVLHPATTALDISFASLGRDLHVYCDCLVAIVLDKIDAWLSLDKLPFRCLSLACTGTKHKGSFLLRLSQDDFNLDPSTPTREIPFFQLSSQGAEPVDQTFFVALVHALPLADSITSASITQSGGYWHMLNWAELLTSLTQLEVLRLGYETHRGPARRAAPSRKISALDPAALAPRLRLLAVSEARVSHLDPSHSVPLAQLAFALSARADSARRAGDTHGLVVQVERDGMLPWPRLPQSKVSRWLGSLLPSSSSTARSRR
ncbi:hypothetical protein PsYK624_053890 [Phanerochaete sordida]|uniref:F-box domain-containing protein n=1 Tax=Phanerochaete sordida TaxID=48140 RepID=A0A9P3LCW7_9APHY|nr:hypothetical protein PsYK624_053890 [Phanerochaete sordida]